MRAFFVGWSTGAQFRDGWRYACIMAVYRLGKQSIDKLNEATFAERGVRERADLQRLLRANIDVIDNDVLVIAEEFGEWQDSRRRIDLLGVDGQGNLVVIELKRDDEGGHMELQAIRYAAMVSGMTFARAVEVYQQFLDRSGSGKDAKTLLLEFLHWEDVREEEFARDVRIVLVAADFSKELTTAVIWLNNRELDIRCVRLKPYELDGVTILDVQQVIPLMEAADYQVQLKAKDQAVRQGEAERHPLRLAFWKSLIPAAARRTPRFADLTPGRDSWISATAGVPGFKFTYVVWQDSAASECFIYRGPDSESFNKAAFDALWARRQEIETVFGEPLQWERLDGKVGSRIRYDGITGGIKSPKEGWPQIQEAMIDSMARLEKALVPHLEHALQAGSAASS